MRLVAQHDVLELKWDETEKWENETNIGNRLFAFSPQKYIDLINKYLPSMKKLHIVE